MRRRLHAWVLVVAFGALPGAAAAQERAVRAEQQFSAEISDYMRRAFFTRQLIQQRSELSPTEQKQFDAELERYMRAYAFTQRLQAQQQEQHEQEFTSESALQERKLTFTRQLLQSRKPNRCAP